jgi:lipopolysaccharide export system protein LptA
MLPDRIVKYLRGIVLFPLLLALLACLPEVAKAQKVTRVNLEKANVMRLVTEGGKSVQRLIGDVVLRQDSTYFYSDTAALDENNNFSAVGNIHIAYSDSVHLYGKFLKYSGNSRVAVLDSNVILVDPRATLYTDHLEFDRNKGIAYYFTGGKIVDRDNVLTSIIGRYFTDNYMFLFKDSVVATSPDYTMYADSLKYNTETEIVYLIGPTDIYGDKDHIYSEQGWYDTKDDRSELTLNNQITHEDQILKANWIYYDRGKEYGKALGNVWMKDTLQNVIMEGEISEFFRRERHSYITDSARAILIEEQDSLFMHADSFMMVMDSADKAKFIFAYHHMKFFRSDMQGKCDSLVYKVNDSLISMLGNPVVWSDENQLTSDSIWMHISNNRVDSMVMFNMAFIISRDSTETFNQIKGKQMRAYFNENRLYLIKVFGNAETVYYIREDNNDLIGINSSVSSDMVILVNNNKINQIIYLKMPDAVLYPENDFPKDKHFLKDFKWIEDQRPLDKSGIYIWKEEAISEPKPESERGPVEDSEPENGSED